MTKILVPVDGSNESGVALTWACKTAEALGGSVTLINVFELDSAEVMALANMSREDIAEKIERNAAPHFEKAKAAAGSGADNCEVIAVIGNPADEILGYAETQGFDHIVMGRRGLSPLSELMLGSVSEKVMKRAGCAVTVLH